MDPNAALQAIREAIAATGIDPTRNDFNDVICESATTIADNFEALDTWLSGGGFLPAAWALGLE